MSSAEIDRLAARLAPHYSRFDVANRLLFTGHSHQAWPDVAWEGLAQAYAVTARDVDEKWGEAFARTEVLRHYLRRWYDDPDGGYTLGTNTHMLLVSWLSSLDLGSKPQLITTDGEFHSLRRQLGRLREAGLTVTALPAAADDFLQQLDAASARPTAAILLSRVGFETARIRDDLGPIASLARQRQIPLLIDDYHGTNVAPLSLRDAGLQDCYLVTGGYKYLQWGEGNCFLRFPPDCQLRPVVTGWFAAFASLEGPQDPQAPTPYDDGQQRFASGTYDPVSQFRAARVAEFFSEQQLDAATLRGQYQRQLAYMRRCLADADLDPAQLRLLESGPLAQYAGFMPLHSAGAGELQQRLAANGVQTDRRGECLRFGLAPYLGAAQIEQAMQTLRRCLS